MDVEAYLNRMKYSGSREPTLSTLAELIKCHKENIPYSNLQMHGGSQCRISLEDTYKNVVTNNGAGICYELGGLFVWMLRELGFTAYAFQGQFWGDFFDPPSFLPPYSHFLTVAEVEGVRYLVDPGWVMYGPMRFEVGLPHVETHAVYRIMPSDFGENFYDLWRHKKTVLDSEGTLLKQGPKPAGPLDDVKHPDWSKTQDGDWTLNFRFEAVPREMSDFKMVDWLYEEGCVMNANVIMLEFSGKNSTMSFAKPSGYTTKESVDPVTDRIVADVKWETNDEIVKSAKDVYKYDVLHKVTHFK